MPSTSRPSALPRLASDGVEMKQTMYESSGRTKSLMRCTIRGRAQILSLRLTSNVESWQGTISSRSRACAADTPLWAQTSLR